MNIIPSTSGIYRINCSTTGKFYIGSAVDLGARRRRHWHDLRNSVHHSITLQRAWDKYGEDAFTFEVLELVLVPFHLEREQYWLDTLKPFDPSIGYNIASSAQAARLGLTHTPETREKLRLANLGKKQSEETRQKRSDLGKLRTQSEETKEKVRQIRLGTKRSDESRERSRISHLGKKQTQDVIDKRIAARAGYSHSEETRAQIRAANANHPSHVKRMQTLIIISPDGVEHTVTGIGKFCRENALNHSALIQVAKGIHPHHKHWTARYL